jgi:hypothetical protein
VLLEGAVSQNVTRHSKGQITVGYLLLRRLF